MGYEINFKYHPEGEERGKYDESKIESKTIKVGSPYEEVPLEIAAGKIISQLARRNILVVDVEVYEYTKKKLTYKEAPDGIIIKHKKFSFDDGAVMDVSDVGEQDLGLTTRSQSSPQQDALSLLMAALSNNPQVAAILQGSQNPKPVGVKPPAIPGLGKPIRHEVFDPEPFLLGESKKRGLAFTPKKQYPIYKERASPNFQAGMLYTTIDDNGNRQVVSDKHFVPPPNLDKTFLEIHNNEVPNLSWEGVVHDEGMRQDFTGADDKILDIRNR